MFLDQYMKDQGLRTLSGTEQTAQAFGHVPVMQDSPELLENMKRCVKQQVAEQMSAFYYQ